MIQMLFAGWCYDCAGNKEADDASFHFVQCFTSCACCTCLIHCLIIFVHLVHFVHCCPVLSCAVHIIAERETWKQTDSDWFRLILIGSCNWLGMLRCGRFVRFVRFGLQRKARRLDSSRGVAARFIPLRSFAPAGTESWRRTGCRNDTAVKLSPWLCAVAPLEPAAVFSVKCECWLYLFPKTDLRVGPVLFDPAISMPNPHIIANLKLANCPTFSSAARELEHDFQCYCVLVLPTCSSSSSCSCCCYYSKLCEFGENNLLWTYQ